MDSKTNQMRKVGKKRAAELRHYDRTKAELEQELKLCDEWCCVFSSSPIPDHYTWKEVSWHHLKGRDGDLLVDKKFLRPCANLFHTGDEGYHNKPISYLKNLWWWHVYMSNLRAIDEDLWYSIKLKEEK